MSGPPAGYIEVNERIAKFRAEYPDGRLRPLNPERPCWLEQAGDQWFVVYAAAAFRTPDDPCPGVGVAWEPVPGRTSFTKDSELMNAETSAWGRALIAAGIADAKEGIASANEVRNRAPVRSRTAPRPVDEGQTWDDPAPSSPSPERLTAFKASCSDLRDWLPAGMTVDGLRHKIVGRVTRGRSESSNDLTDTELTEAFRQLERASAQFKPHGA